jgi:hypothetical protein
MLELYLNFPTHFQGVVINYAQGQFYFLRTLRYCHVLVTKHGVWLGNWIC